MQSKPLPLVWKAESSSHDIRFYSAAKRGHFAQVSIYGDNIYTTYEYSQEAADALTKKINNDNTPIRIPNLIIWLSIIIIGLCELTLQIPRPIHLALGTAFLLCAANHTIKKIIRPYFDIGKTKEERKSFKRNHAAEHKVLEAYERLEKIPTLKEAKRQSRLSSDCGVNKVTPPIVKFLWLSFCSFTLDYATLIIALLIGMMSIEWLYDFYLMNFLQLFLTSPPRDQDLKAAINGLELLLSHETT